MTEVALTLSEVARRLGINRALALKHIHSGALRAIRRNPDARRSGWLVLERDLAEFTARSRGVLIEVAPKTEPPRVARMSLVTRQRMSESKTRMWARRKAAWAATAAVAAAMGEATA